MALPPGTAKTADERFIKYRPLFDAQAFALDRLYAAFQEHQDVIKVRQGAERNLSLLVPLAIGKGAKTCSAVRYLCWLGYGEDAAILVRANLNLLIKLAYIASDPVPLERAAEFLAYSYLEREKYLKLGHHAKMAIPPPMAPEKNALYAKRWKDASIETKADRARLKGFHYDKAYRYFSSMEHSDAFSLNALLGEWNEVGPVIRGEDDQGVDIALFCNFLTASDLTLAMLQYYRLQCPEVVTELRAKLQELEKWDRHQNNKPNAP